MQASGSLRFTAVALIAIVTSEVGAQSAQADYARLCSGCHGASFRVQATDESQSRGEAERAVIIRNGLPLKGMPAFGAQLPEARIRALAQLIQDRVANRGAALGVSVEAETLDEMTSAGYVFMSTEQRPGTRFVGYFGERSSLCYRDVDLTGVRSIELTYARGSDDPARFAVLVGDGKKLRAST